MYKVVRVFQVTAHGHLPGAIAAVHIPLAPIEGICWPGGEIAAVGRGAVGRVGEDGAGAGRVVGHAGVGARADVGQAQG